MCVFEVLPDETIASLIEEGIVSQFFADVRDELAAAERKVAPLNRLHEAYVVMVEELDELRDEAKRHDGSRRAECQYRELVLIAAMAVQTVKDLKIQNGSPAEEK